MTWKSRELFRNNKLVLTLNQSVSGLRLWHKSINLRFLIIAFLLLCILNLTGCQSIDVGMLNPKGVIAHQQKQLFFDAIALMLIVVIPVFIMSFVFVYRYRSSRKTADYKPNWAHSVFLEMIWWLVPFGIIFVLAIITWVMTHRLDPYRSITTAGKPMLIKVVALPWKWLFIYPEANIATVNFLEIPIKQQVLFWLTADNVPMSSFFIPQLGSQIYTMAGMRTKLHLLATEKGLFDGLNAQFNGDGFSEMHFKVKVVDQDEMQQWVKQIKQSSNQLTNSSYQQLLKPTINAPIQYFSSVTQGLFADVIKKYKQTGPIPFRQQSH